MTGLRAIGKGMSSSQDPLFSGLRQAVRVGTELIAALVVGGAIGYFADYFFNTTPLFLFIGFFVGVSAGLLNVYRIASRL